MADYDADNLPSVLDICRKKPLTLLPLIALIFFEVSGGPFGTEVRPQTALSKLSAHSCDQQQPSDC
jgi:hypothetical protein